MSATQQRDQVCDLAKRDPKRAHQRAQKIEDPWFRAQALSWVLRYTQGDGRIVAQQAAKAAQACDDQYKRTAVRAWEVAALGERGQTAEARIVLRSVLREAKSVQPPSSRAEALMLLLQAAMILGRKEAGEVYDLLTKTCSEGDHWRCRRAIRDGKRMFSAEIKARSFFG